MGSREIGQPPSALVTLERFLDPVQAQMAKGLLESAGIVCFLQGEHANQMVPLAFRVRLQVPASDFAAARELLGSIAGDEDEREVRGHADRQ